MGEVPEITKLYICVDAGMDCILDWKELLLNVALLRDQRNCLVALDAPTRKDLEMLQGLINMIDRLLDIAEGYDVE